MRIARHRWTTTRIRVPSVALMRLAALMLMQPRWARAAPETRFTMQPPQTIIAQEIYDLHGIVLGICILIAVAVFAVMLYSIFKFRKSAERQASQFSSSTPLEITWTMIPCLIVAGMAYPATRTVVQMKDTSSPDLTIKVTGYQWKWRYTYLNENVDSYSELSTPRDQIANAEPKGENYLLEVDNPMVVPVGKKVRILTTADDVIHAWWVPALGVKQDAIPGLVRDSRSSAG